MSKIKTTGFFHSSKSHINVEPTSAFDRMQQKYWTTRQIFTKKFCKDNDDTLISNDSQLDEKLAAGEEVAASVLQLLSVLESYQSANSELATREEGLGMFLKSSGVADKSRARDILTSVGKYFSQISKKRMSLEKILVRLYEELETFLHQAVGDMSKTVEEMEQVRSTYQGSLLWMKEFSGSLDPEHDAKLKKFRKIQLQVRKNKGKFDDVKLKTMQKVDLLAFSRLNLFSKNLSVYLKRLSDTFRVLSDSSRDLVNSATADSVPCPFETVRVPHDVQRKIAPAKSREISLVDEQKHEESRQVVDLDLQKVEERFEDLIQLDDDIKTNDVVQSYPDLLDEVIGTDFLQEPSTSVVTEVNDFAHGTSHRDTGHQEIETSPFQDKTKPIYFPSVLLDAQPSNPEISIADFEIPNSSAGDFGKQCGQLSWFESVAEFDPLLRPSTERNSGSRC